MDVFIVGPPYTEISTVPDDSVLSLVQRKVVVMPHQQVDVEAPIQGLSAVHSVKAYGVAQPDHPWSLLWLQGLVLPAHPFPSLNFDDVKTTPTIICSVVLFFGALLCSAGGIGGGGIYVTVLMVAGQLIPHDAVPLSKAVVFFGSLSSLFLNVKKSLAMQEGGKPETLIDYNICRLVVPCALLGTLVGVMVNSLIPAWSIVAMLVLILCAMTYMSSQKFLTQYRQETMEATDGGGEAVTANAIEQPVGEDSIRGILLRGEGLGSFALLAFVVLCGAFRQHAENCRSEVLQAQKDTSVDVPSACVRPVVKIFLGSSLNNWMSNTLLSNSLPVVLVAIPACICIAIAGTYSRTLMKEEGWSPKQVCSYSIMALFTGCFAGLVGIGGGLVFSPFMLWMGLHSSVAVATSSTCVIFTSSSTTMQYLLTDRIILSLALIYGLVSSIASYIGTSAVHLLHDKYSTRESYISGVVCLGVFSSVILSLYQLGSMGIGD